MEPKRQLKSLSDDELLRRLSELLRQSRRVEAELVAHIAEVDLRRLYAREASPSMYAYCTEVLHLSEQEAYLRIAAARASRQHPVLLEMLADGRLHLSGIAKLAPHLTRENRDDVLRRATRRSKRQIEELVAALLPRPDVPALMRKLPERRENAQPVPVSRPSPNRVDEPLWKLGPDRVASPAVSAPSPAPAPVRPPVVEPLAPSRYRVQFTASAGLQGKLERLRALMRPSVPDGDLATIIEAAVTEKLERLEAQRFAKTSAPRKTIEETDTSASSRHIPAAVRRIVYERDGGRCRYVDRLGRRCTAREGLEFHHLQPYGRGGDHDPANLQLMCKVHNSLLAEREYGRDKIARFRRPGGVSEGVAVYATARVGLARARAPD